MKKLCLAVLFLALSFIHVYADIPEKIKVGLFYNSTALERVTLLIDGQELTMLAADIADEKLFTSDSGVIAVNGRQYRGDIILRKDDAGKLTVINEVDMEDYVASVVSKEMSPSFEIEALKAQAVCARTYAAVNLNKHMKYGFSVCSTVDCQAYGGIEGEHQNTIRAAQETGGEILTYNGEPAQTVYFATSGGYTEDVKYVWGSEFPYLVAVPDAYESSDCYAYRWTRELSPERATQILAAKGYDIGNVTDIQIVSATDTGVVYKLKVVGDKGEKIFTNESCRTLFGYDVLLSQAYTLGRGGITVNTTGGKASTANLHVLSADGVTAYSSEKLYLLGSAEAAVTTPKPSQNFIFSGRGNGHLVGMSQNGANGMAKAGYKYDEILTHYYQGTKVSKGDNVEHERI